MSSPTPVPAYLSTEWFDAADRLVRDDPTLRERSLGVHLVVQHTVVDDDGRSTIWHLVLDDGEVSLRVGAAPAPDIAFTCDRATAEAVRDGSESATTAFISGRLRLDGSAAALLEHASTFADLGDVLGPLR